VIRSLTYGTLCSVTVSGVSSVAARHGNAEFFAPPISTFPLSGLPPRILNLSILKLIDPILGRYGLSSAYAIENKSLSQPQFVLIIVGCPWHINLAKSTHVSQNRYVVPNSLQTHREIEFESKAILSADAELVSRCSRGDQAAWDELVDKYQRLIFSIPRRAGLNEEQAADVFQDVFLTLFEKIAEIEQPDRIRSWMVTTAKFKTWAVVRGSKGFHSPGTEEEMEAEMESLMDNAPLADDLLIELEEQHMIRSAVKELDEKCRQILSMIYLRDTPASYAEVAVSIGVGESSISPLRSRCLKKLEKILR
jgi:RNA polymerase sigma factor (sigma-70 family)